MPLSLTFEFNWGRRHAVLPSNEEMPAANAESGAHGQSRHSQATAEVTRPTIYCPITTPFHEPERRSPTRCVEKRSNPHRAGSETGAPIARCMASTRNSRIVVTFHEPRSSRREEALTGKSEIRNPNLNRASLRRLLR